VTTLDAIVCALLALAAWAFVTGDGPHGTVAGVRISMTSELRLSLAAALVAGLRHLTFRRPSLRDRVWPLIQRVRYAAPPRPLAPDEFFDRPVAVRIGPLEIGLVAVLMAALTAVMTYPQIARLDAVRDLGDPVFSIWRLKWIAHQLTTDPLHLFDANIFYPERYTLAFSDSILLPALVAAPFLWSGAPAVAVYNVWMLVTFALAGVTMYALVRTLTGQAPAALVAAVIFAFYPFRFEHYPHFELQFSFWMPLVLLALHHMLLRGRTRDGLLGGAALGAQILSSVYFGIFLSAYAVVVGGVAAFARGCAKTRMKPALAGFALAGLLAAPLAWPYLQVRASQGDRGYFEMDYYSAAGGRYLVPHLSSTTYATPLTRAAHEGEKDLFPGILAVALALVAVWPPLSATRIAYTAGLVFAFEASLGTHGYLFPMLAEHVLPFRGLRVPARYSMLVGLSLAILAGYGVARLNGRLTVRPLRYLLAIALATVVLFESRATLPLEHVPEPHAVYAWFNGRPSGVIAELPAPPADAIGADVRYLYPATFHWQRMLNGNSGHFPASNLAFCAAMQTFPDDRSIALLQKRGVDHVIVHEEYYGRAAYQTVVGAMSQRPELQEVVHAQDRGFEARIYRLAKATGNR
jgi:hypothetical protein